jgi:hypothetical protein
VAESFGTRGLNILSNKEQKSMEYKVVFGIGFSADGFRFVGKGKIQIEQDRVIFVGKKSWPFIAKFGIFLLITVVPLFLFGFGLGWLGALFVFYYFCVSNGSLTIERSTISNVSRNRRIISFKAQHPKLRETKRTIFKVESEQQALQLESNLLSYTYGGQRI